MSRYVVYDVFTDRPFGGNQLAVFPDATNLPEAQLQAITAEFNFSEVTFVYPPKDPENTAAVRIFTPTSEVPFAGHPTIGTAIALREEGHTGDMVLELGIGPIPCTFDDDRATFRNESELEILAKPDVELVARALSLPTAAIRTDIHPPTQASVGLPFVLTQLTDANALSRANPAIDAIREGAAKHPAGMDFAIFCYTRDGTEVEARMFAPLDNIPEDPATGSASAALAMLLRDQTNRLDICQGRARGRLSRITAQTDAHGVAISGRAVKVMEGQLILPDAAS